MSFSTRLARQFVCVRPAWRRSTAPYTSSASEASTPTGYIISKNEMKRQAKYARKAAFRQARCGGAVLSPVWPRPKSIGNVTRYCAVISFDGARYHGWQRQHPPGVAPLRTVQAELEEGARRALQQVLAWREYNRYDTDSGVSALGQVCQFDAATAMTPAQICDVVNAELPPDLYMRRVSVAGPKFSAMASAKWKRYVYTAGPSFGSYFNEIPPSPMCIERASEAARRLVGTHDFAGFQAKGGRSTTVRTLFRLGVADVGDCQLRIEMEGDGFLYKMARIIAGSLVEIGVGLRPVEHIDLVLQSADRRLAGPTLPAAGLSLNYVELHDDWSAAVADKQPSRLPWSFLPLESS